MAKKSAKASGKKSGKVSGNVKAKKTKSAPAKSTAKSVSTKSKQAKSTQIKSNKKVSMKAKAVKPAPKNKIALKKASKPVEKSVGQTTSSKKLNTKNVAVTPQQKINSKFLNEGAPFSPLGDKVLIIRAKGGVEKTAGGLFIPSSAQEKPTEGKVIAVGPGVKSKKGFLKPLDVKVGDKVMYEKYAGMELKFGAEEFLILTENEIIGVVS